MTNKEVKKKIEALRHIQLSDMDNGLIGSIKTNMFHNHKSLFNKLRIASDAVNKKALGAMNNNDIELVLMGGALMYQIMVNPEFLKDCKNIYNEF